LGSQHGRLELSIANPHAQKGHRGAFASEGYSQGRQAPPMIQNYLDSKALHKYDS
jgi:hypothetical protein